jgi:hypothetical protein
MNDDLFEFEYVDEIDDIQIADSQRFGDAVVTSTDWTTETVLSQLHRGNIQLSPRFQRRDAWDISRKSKFLESLFLGLPVPQIVLAEQQGQRGQFLVLDGKQRLLTLLQFTGGGTGRNNGFSLRSLDIRKDLRGKSYEDIKADATCKADVDAFLNQTIRTVVVRNWPSSEFLFLVFVRLNTGSVALSPQELRQALLPGEFVNYVDDKAADSPTLRKLLKTKEPDFRMRDTELLLRFIAFRFFLNRYRGDLKKFLDETCRDLNASWENERERIESAVGQFEQATDLCFQIFSERHVARRWIKESFQGQFNRAIFDVLVYYFADQDTREKSRPKKREILDAFKSLCDSSQDFVDSITSTTKSIGATYTRLRLWGEALDGIVPGISLPVLDENQIVVSGRTET